MKILNNREARKVLKEIEEHWACKLGEILETHSLIISKKKKIYLIHRDFHSLPLDMHINSIGSYVANVRDAKLRLTIEGSELVGPKASKNVVEINDEEAQDWIRGKNLIGERDVSGFVIVKYVHKHGIDFMGCGHYKNDIVTNFVPKTRRIHAE